MFPTSSMSGVRKQRWEEVRRDFGGVSSPRKNGWNGCIPATVSRVDVSVGAGISEAEGTRRCSRPSKNDRYVSRICAEFMVHPSRCERCRLRNRTPGVPDQAMVPWPTMRSPSSRTAVWPGEPVLAGAVSSTARRSCRPGPTSRRGPSCTRQLSGWER